MSARAPARLLAPLALVVFAVVLVMVISSAGGGGGGSKTSQAKGRHPTVARPHAPPRRYTVSSSDNSLDEIARKTGVPTDRLVQLNPDLDPQTLIPGQRIKLRP